VGSHPGAGRDRQVRAENSMCRWLAYLGEPVFLEDFVSKPCQSLIAQSRHCREAKSEVNADGFGVGWYGERERPGLFRDVLVVSEPIDDASIGWDSVPPQSFVRIDRAGIGVSPFRRS
jgi:predicted glutamine amidotransferase